jgi:hypothetical protein
VNGGGGGVGFYQGHERAAGVVHSGEGFHRLTVVMMPALFVRRTPSWGYHGEALRTCRVGLSG